MNTLPGVSVHVRARSTSARSHGNEQHPPRSRFTVHSLERQIRKRESGDAKKREAALPPLTGSLNGSEAFKHHQLAAPLALMLAYTTALFTHLTVHLADLYHANSDSSLRRNVLQKRKIME